MKRIILLTFINLPVLLFAQDTDSTARNILMNRAVENLYYLSNDLSIKGRVQIDNLGIIIYKDTDKSAVDFSLKWDEIEKFIEVVENWDYYTMVKTLSDQSALSFSKGYSKDLLNTYKGLPTKWTGLRICLDPGHFGGSMEEAKYEERYARFRKQDIGTNQDVEYYEADLTYAICVILKKLIEKSGGTVLITRPYGTGSLGKSFDKWYKEDFQKSVDNSKIKGDISNDLYNELVNPLAERKYVFENYYKFVEFRKRVEKINEFKPDMTLAIHLNSKEGNRRFGDRYLIPVDDNYNMGFIPGAFLADELVKMDQKIDFVRLLISRDLDNSKRLGNEIIKSLQLNLNVNPIPFENPLRVLREVSIATDAQGVYSRNLVLTRMSRGTVFYIEALYQDNKDEIKKLSTLNYEIDIDGYGKKKIPLRCNEVAFGCWKGIENYLLLNKKLLHQK